ncbi:MAG: hypothetical protein U1F37_11415 [Alphaproteobacteria bacterium]
MPSIRPHDNGFEAERPCAARTPSGDAPLSAGARYRQHLDRFPERAADTALERAARALIRIAQIRSKAPPRTG